MLASHARARGFDSHRVHMDSKQLGFLGEKVALDYLKRKGYQILDKNYSSKFIPGPRRGEIDIVVKKEDTISFVEVKTLTSDGIIQPEEKVDYLKQKKLIKTANQWLMEKRIPLDTKWQIDAISLKINSNSKQAKIRHFQNAVF
jgi:putative endonuclease